MCQLYLPKQPFDPKDPAVIERVLDDTEFQQTYSDFIREKYGIAQPFADEDDK